MKNENEKPEAVETETAEAVEITAEAVTRTEDEEMEFLLASGFDNAEAVEILERRTFGAIDSEYKAEKQLEGARGEILASAVLTSAMIAVLGLKTPTGKLAATYTRTYEHYIAVWGGEIGAKKFDSWARGVREEVKPLGYKVKPIKQTRDGKRVYVAVQVFEYVAPKTPEQEAAEISGDTAPASTAPASTAPASTAPAGQGAPIGQGKHGRELLDVLLADALRRSECDKEQMLDWLFEHSSKTQLSAALFAHGYLLREVAEANTARGIADALAAREAEAEAARKAEAEAEANKPKRTRRPRGKANA